MSKYLKLIAVMFVLPVFAFAKHVMAADQGQIEGGDIYRVKNVTQNVDFVDPASANACDTLMYKVRVHNPGPSPIHSVSVAATLASAAANSNTSTVTVSSSDADPRSTSDTAVVNLTSSQSLSYQNGTTQLLDANNNLIRTLPDGIVGGSVNIGDVGVSINEKRFVQFQVKVSCPSKPTPTPTPITPVPKTLPNTGAGDVLGIFAGASAAGTAAHMAVSARRNRR